MMLLMMRMFMMIIYTKDLLKTNVGPVLAASVSVSSYAASLVDSEPYSLVSPSFRALTIFPPLLQGIP